MTSSRLRPSGRRVALAAAASLGLILAACGGRSSPVATSTPSTSAAGAPEANAAGDIPDNQAFVSYTPPAGGFSLKVPEGWAQTEVGGLTTFTDKFNSITIQAQPMAASPTVASTQQDELAAIRSAVANYRPGKVTMVSRPAGPAVLVTYGADAPPNAVTSKVVALDVERYEFWKAATAVVVTLSGPHGADNVDPWKTVTNSFVWN